MPPTLVRRPFRADLSLVLSLVAWDTALTVTLNSPAKCIIHTSTCSHTNVVFINVHSSKSDRERSLHGLPSAGWARHNWKSSPWLSGAASATLSSRSREAATSRQLTAELCQSVFQRQRYFSAQSTLWRCFNGDGQDTHPAWVRFLSPGCLGRSPPWGTGSPRQKAAVWDTW